MENAFSDADYVQENVAQNIGIKIEVYHEMKRFARIICIFGGSTSGIVASAITSGLKTPERCMIAHPLTPPYLIPAVDLVRSQFTSHSAMERAAELLPSCAQSPICARKEYPGLLTVHLQGAIYDEAFRLVSEDLAAPEDVDICIRDGLTLRWYFTGPFKIAPVGVRDFVGRYGQIYRDLYPQGGPTRWDGALMDESKNARCAKLSIANQPARQHSCEQRLISLVEHKRNQHRPDSIANYEN